MIGYVKVTAKAVETHRDTYLLDKITAVSVRRPAMIPAAIANLAGVVFLMAWHDVLYANEVYALLGFMGITLFMGIHIGQLKFVSRDLNGNPLSNVVIGRYSALNAKRRQIAAKMGRFDAGEAA